MRLRSKHLSGLSALAIAALLGQSGSAQSIYDGFRLTFPLYNTGSGFTAAWQPGGFNASAAGYTAGERSLAFNGLVTTPGHVSAGAFATINGAIRDLAQPLGASNTTAYMSVLLRPQGTLNAGLFNGFFGVTLSGSTGQELFAGKPGAGDVQEYVIENRGGAGQVSSGVPTVVGEAALLVVKAQFMAGTDVFTLYVNPAPGAAEPGSGAVKMDLDLGTVSRIGIYSTGAFDVDEIRIGTTYAEVTPVTAFGGTPGAPSCHGKSISALAKQNGGLPNAAEALGFASVSALQGAISAYCGN